MDPNVVYDRMTEALSCFSMQDDEAIKADAAEALADAVDSLNAWLSNGGFLPDAWRKGRTS